MFLAGHWLDDPKSCSQNQLDHFKMITDRNIKDSNNNNNKVDASDFTFCSQALKHKYVKRQSHPTAPATVVPPVELIRF